MLPNRNVLLESDRDPEFAANPHLFVKTYAFSSNRMAIIRDTYASEGAAISYEFIPSNNVMGQSPIESISENKYGVRSYQSKRPLMFPINEVVENSTETGRIYTFQIK